MLGTHIIRHRRLTGKTQKELGLELGLTAMAVSYLERNRTKPSLQTMKRLMEVIKVPMEVFFESESSKTD